MLGPKDPMSCKAQLTRDRPLDPSTNELILSVVNTKQIEKQHKLLRTTRSRDLQLARSTVSIDPDTRIYMTVASPSNIENTLV